MFYFFTFMSLDSHMIKLIPSEFLKLSVVPLPLVDMSTFPTDL